MYMNSRTVVEVGAVYVDCSSKTFFDFLFESFIHDCRLLHFPQALMKTTISPPFLQNHARIEPPNAHKPTAAFRQTLRRCIGAPPLPLARIRFFSPQLGNQEPPSLLHLALLYSHPPLPPLRPPLQSDSRFLRHGGLQVHAGAP